MAGKSTKALALLLLLLVYVAALVQTGLAALEVETYERRPEDPRDCWSSIRRIDGCVHEIYGAHRRGQAGAVGPKCCMALSAIHDNCWPRIFPHNPFFPSQLKKHCDLHHHHNHHHRHHHHGGRGGAAAPAPVPAAAPAVAPVAGAEPTGAWW